MERNLEYIAYLLEQSEKKMALLDGKITFLNKLLVVVGVLMLFLYIYK